MTTLTVTLTPRRRPVLTLRRRVAFSAIAGGVVLAGAFVAAELALRVRAGDWGFAYLGPSVGAVPAVGDGPTRFDAQLGYVPAPGRHDWGRWSSTVRADGMRAGAPRGATASAVVLAVGDSFTFGDEVADDETWPARLEQAIGAPVANGGVFGYGIDQAVLRAERQLSAGSPAPRCVVLALVSDDVSRCELSCRHVYKPWFEIGNDAADFGLVHHHDPVPNVAPSIPWDRALAGRSFVVRALARRVAPTWWYLTDAWREHADGDAVAVRLIERLHAACAAREVRLLVVTLCGRGRDRSRLGTVVDGARAAGVTVLELADALAARPDADFMPEGHLGPDANAWVAQRVGETLGSM